MRAGGNIIKWIGVVLVVLGFGIILLHIFLGGPWPEPIRPIQNLFTYFDQWDYIGKAIEGAIVVGPGAVLTVAGMALEERSKRS